MANEGEFFGGLGYLGHKAFGGIVGSLEGIWDYAAGGIAEIFGAHKFAEEQLKNDWIDYNAADEWFKPSGGWKTAGDVLSGIGNSLPSLAASIAVAAATGGASAAVQLAAGAGTSFGVSFLSAGGNATKEAYQESGKLSGEEWGYGSLSGLTEGAVESAGTVLGLGQGAVLKALGKSAAKSAARTGLRKVLVDGFAGEAAEEFVSTAISPYLKRVTYDKDAKNATAEELAYSAVVGGLSGMLMGGGGYGARTAMDYISGGANVKSEEKREQIIKAATAIKNFESTAKTGNEVFEEISNAVDKLQAGLAKNGRYTVSEVKQLGYLNERIGTALMQPQFMQAAYTVLENPEATVESINRFYNSDNLTVDELTKGVDQSKIGSKAWQKSVAKALKSNTTLRELVAIQTLGAIELDARQYADAIFDGTPISTVATQDNLNRFVSSKDDATVSAVSSTLGIDLRTATADELAAAIKTARDNGSIDQYREAVESVEKAKSVDTTKAKNLPTTVYARNDGARVYAVGDNRYAIIKKGNNYRLYDYSSGNISIPMSLAEMNAVVKAVKNQLESLKSDSKGDIINKNETENRSNESERVRIRDGGERSGGQDTEGQVSRMEGGAGQAESRGEASRNRNVEAARQADEGRGVKYVAVEDETASMKKARKLAEERGLKVRFFTGENLTVKDENGKTISARAYIKGNRVLVRADHQVYTEEQLMRHELGHNKIAKGEVDIKKVRRRLKKTVGKENIDKVAKLYAEAYAGTGMTAKEIWEECICDSLGDMNIFAGEDAKALLDKIIPEVKKAASENKEPSKTREPPRGKTSRELDSDGNPIYETEKRITEPTDFKLLRQRWKAASEKYGLSEKESSALKAYVMGIAYTANKRLLGGNTSDSDIAYIQSIIEAAKKFPVYEGRTYRNLIFKDEQSYNAYLEENSQGKVVGLKAITSTSKKPNGYPLRGKYVVHMVLDGVSGRDIADTYGIPKQQEVMFLPGDRYKVNSVSVANDGHPIIFAKEIANNEVQIGEGDYEGRKLESTRNSGNDRQVSRREGDDGGRVLLRDGRGEQTDRRGGGREVHNANNLNGKASRELDTEVKAPADGMAAKAKAEKQNYKVYNKSEVLKAIRSIKLVADLTSKQRDDIATKLWVELNAPDKIKAKEEYLQGCLNRVKDGILNAYDKAASDSNGKAISDPDTIKSLEGDIFDAVITLVELGGHESEKTKFNSKNKSQNKAEPKKLNELKPVYHVSDVVKALKNIPGNEIISPEVHNRLEIEMVAELNKLDSRIDEIEFVREYSEKILNMVKTEKELENLTKESRAKAKGHIVDVLDKMLLDVKSRGPENIYDEKSWYQRTLENVRAQNEEAFAREKSRHLAEEAKHREKSKSALQKEKEYNRSVLENTRAQNDDRFERMKARDREKIAEQNKYYKVKEALNKTAQSIRNKLNGSTFDNATVYQGESIKGLLSEVSAFEYSGTFSENEVRAKIKKLFSWYNKDNPMLCYEDEQNPGVYVESIHDALEVLALGNKKLTAEELRALDGVLRHFVHLAENYRKAWMDGKWVEAAPLAKKYAETVTRSAADVTNVLKIYRNGYVAAAGTPETVMLAADGYVDGFFSKMQTELRSAEKNADIEIMEIEREVDDFLKANKKYSEKLSNKTVEIFGEKFSKLELMEYYMTLKRKQAHEALAYNGIILKSKEDGKGEDLVIGGFAQGQKDLTEEQLETLAAARRAEIEKEFSEKDKAFVKLLEKGYEATRDIKREADLKRLGISNVIEGYYYPIKRSYAKTKTVDVGAEAGFVDRFAYASFNKHAKEGAQQPIAIGSAYDTFTRHVKGIVYYSKVSPVVDTYNKMWKLNLSENNNTPRSLETLNSQSKATWRDKKNNIVGNKYFRDEVYNIMNGSYARNALGSETIGGIRGKGAVAALAANLKVMITQISSWFAASSKLSYDSLVKGLGVSAKDVDKYCKLAELRNRDKTAVKASGVIDTIGGVGEFLTKHISIMDRVVVCRLFGACQVEVAKNGGAKIGTEENKIAAGKLLESVILETQQNSFVTTKNNMARNGGELLKSLMMFRSDAVQTQGKVLSEVGRAWAIRKRLKNGNLSDAERATLKAELKKCNRNAGKAVFALALSSVWVVGASHIMNALFNKERDKDEELWVSALLDLGGNMLGGLPGFADVYEYMVDGFDIESMEMGIINDMLHAAKAAFDYTGKVTSGTAEQRDTNALIKNTLFTLGQASGVPARNLYNLLYGITRRFNESAAYRIDDIFRKQNYNADFKDAAEGGKNELAKDILEMSFESNVGEGISEEALEELTRLASLGLKVAPSAISKSITIDGKEYELTEEEKETVQDIYAEAITELNKLVKSKSYAKLEDAEKEKEIKNLFTRYRKMGYDEVKEKNYGVTKKSSSPYAGLFSSKTSSGTSSGSSSRSYSALFSKNKKTSGAKSDKKLSYGALLGVK